MATERVSTNLEKRLEIHTQPVVDPKIWNPIPDKHIHVAELRTESKQDRSDDSQPKITEEDQFGILCLVQRAVRIEMVDTTEPAVLLALPSALFLHLVVVVTGDIVDEVRRPSTELLTDKVNESPDWSLLG